MQLSQKCLYALRAVFELARAADCKPRTIRDLGAAQGISEVFLQNILRELRQGGFVASRRGRDGGYVLARPAEAITMRQLIRFIEGEPASIDDDIFAPVFREAAEAESEIFGRVTMADLVARSAGRPGCVLVGMGL